MESRLLCYYVGEIKISVRACNISQPLSVCLYQIFLKYVIILNLDFKHFSECRLELYKRRFFAELDRINLFTCKQECGLLKPWSLVSSYKSSPVNLFCLSSSKSLVSLILFETVRMLISVLFPLRTKCSRHDCFRDLLCGPFRHDDRSASSR